MIKSRNHLVIIIIIIALVFTSISLGYSLIRTSNELRNTNINLLRDQAQILTLQDNIVSSQKSLLEAQARIVPLQENVASLQKSLSSFNINPVIGGISLFSDEQDIITWFNNCISNNSDSLQNAREWYPLFEYMLIQGIAIKDGHIISTSMWNGEPVSMAFTPDHTYFLFYSSEDGAKVYKVDGGIGWGISSKEHWVQINPP
jgi:hypothetical protein